MKPWRHAERSLHLPGDRFEEHLACHMFLDCTKDSYAAVPHRYLLHNTDLGGQALKLAFAGRQDTDRILQCHLDDDLGRQPALGDWLAEMRVDMLPVPRKGWMETLNLDEQADYLCKRFQIHNPQLPRDLCDFFSSPDRLAPGVPEAARLFAVRNTMGIAIAERCFGAVHRDLASGGRVGTREIAEVIVSSTVGGIVPYSDIAKAIRLRPWMAGLEEHNPHV